MIFYNDRYPDSTVTSKKNHHRIAQFVNGIFKTENPTIIEKLKKHFKYEESPKVLSGLASFLKLKKEAEEKGIYKSGMKKKDLIKVLEGSEK